ncbi:MAG: hypothetical protein JXX29_14325 [Deltaproteobacteria bacterium]|nr:hypothetical protein [Deltaproteobacteria bacterium]MBN2672855.1 hypothetical protein [Deltaproteobacteria bacterium]
MNNRDQIRLLLVILRKIVLIFLIPMISLPGCLPGIPDGKYRCGADPQASCPTGWYCYINSDVSAEPRCYRDAPDSDIDVDTDSNTDSENDTALPPNVSFSRLGEWAVYNDVFHSYVEGTTAYIARSDYIQILDVSDPVAGKIHEIGKHYTERIVYLMVKNQIVYGIQKNGGASGPDALVVIDAADPERPSLLTVYSLLDEAGELDTENAQFDQLEIYGDDVYLQGQCFLQIVSFSNPEFPQFIWRQGLLVENMVCEGIYSVVRSGNLLYMANGSRGMTVYDVSDLSAPDPLEALVTSESIEDMAITDSHAFFATGKGGLESAFIGELEGMGITGVLPLDTWGHRVEMMGDIAIVSFITHEAGAFMSGDYNILDAGVVAVDVSNPNAMTILDGIGELAEPADIQVVGDRIYITNKEKGLLIYSLDKQ